MFNKIAPVAWIIRTDFPEQIGIAHIWLRGAYRNGLNTPVQTEAEIFLESANLDVLYPTPLP